MVKVVVGDENQLKLAEDRLTQSGFTAQVGLVIGKLSSQLDRGFVFDLVPTPTNDGGEPACSVVENKDEKKKGGSKSKPQVSDASTLLIDTEWVAEHARQVSRMLVGGMNVVGVYVWVSDTSFKNSTITLCQTVKGVAEAAPIVEGGWDERLLIHIAYSPRRWTCRNCMLSSSITSSSIRPCDFKLGKVLSSMQRFRCIYNFELRMPISHERESNASTLSSILRHGISTHVKELRGAKAIIDGNLITNDEPCTTDSLHEVELLLPFTECDHPSTEACSQKDVDGLVVFGGSVCSFTYLNYKEPVSQAVADIKFDIVRSLQSRLDILCDEADEDLAAEDERSEEANQDQLPQKPVSKLALHSLRKTCHLAFPRRVFIPWLGDIYICDYLQPSETLEVIKDHCVELMSMQASTDVSTFFQPELEAPSVISKSFWDVAVPGKSDNSSLSKSREVDASPESSNRQSTETLNFGFPVVAAVLILLISILLGFVFVRKS